MEASGAGLELTYRFGLRANLWYLMGQRVGIAQLTGEWDSAIADVRQALATGVGRHQAAGIESFMLRLLAWRNEASAEDVQRVGDVLQELSDPQIRQSWEQLQAAVAFADGRLGDAYAHELAGHAAGQPDETEEIQLSYRDTTLRFALWQQDPALAQAELDLLAIGRSPLVTARAREAAAAIAAMDGRTTEAVAGFRDAARRQEDIGNRFGKALCQLTMVTLLGSGVPEALDAAKEARVLFTEVRATAFLRFLDDALNAGAGSVSSVVGGGRSQVGEAGGALVGIGDAQDGRLVEGPPDHLEPDR